MSRLGFYCVYAMSWLPLSVLYAIARVLELILRHVWSYRKSVIDGQIQRCFPNTTLQQKTTTLAAFYRFLSIVMVESVKNLSMSRHELQKRIQIKNPEFAEQLYKKGESMVLISGHFHNWEWLITAMPLLIPHQVIGIGTPLSNSFWNSQLNSLRSRFGLKVVHANTYKQQLQSAKTPLAVITLSDQSPPKAHTSYWTRFLNQPTAVAYGPEKMALEYQLNPVFCEITKLKPGYYSVTLIPFPDSNNKWEYGAITEWHTRLLETRIQKEPAFWLWSHRRWKHQPPPSTEEWKKNQLEIFNQRFKQPNK